MISAKNYNRNLVGFVMLFNYSKKLEKKNNGHKQNDVENKCNKTSL